MNPNAQEGRKEPSCTDCGVARRIRRPSRTGSTSKHPPGFFISPHTLLYFREQSKAARLQDCPSDRPELEENTGLCESGKGIRIVSRKNRRRHGLCPRLRISPDRHQGADSCPHTSLFSGDPVFMHGFSDSPLPSRLEGETRAKPGQRLEADPRGWPWPCWWEAGTFRLLCPHHHARNLSSPLCFS